jgi:hypothetical protein
MSSVLDDTAFLMRGAYEGKQVGKGPVGRCAATLEESGHAEDESAGADRGHVLGRAGLPSDKLDRFPVRHRLNDTVGTARNANEIEARAILERVRGNQTEAAFAQYRDC